MKIRKTDRFSIPMTSVWQEASWQEVLWITSIIQYVHSYHLFQMHVQLHLWRVVTEKEALAEQTVTCCRQLPCHLMVTTRDVKFLQQDSCGGRGQKR